MTEVVNTYDKMKEAEEARESLKVIFTEHPKIKQIFDLLDQVRKSKNHADLLIYSIFFSDATTEEFSDLFSSDEELVDITKDNFAGYLINSVLDDGSFRMLRIVNDHPSLTYMRAVLNEDWWDAVPRFVGENDVWGGFPSKIIRVENICITFDMMIKMLQMTIDMDQSGMIDNQAIIKCWEEMFFPEGFLKSKKPHVSYDIDNTNIKIHFFPFYGKEYE